MVISGRLIYFRIKNYFLINIISEMMEYFAFTMNCQWFTHIKFDLPFIELVTIVNFCKFLKGKLF